MRVRIERGHGIQRQPLCKRAKAGHLLRDPPDLLCPIEACAKNLRLLCLPERYVESNAPTAGAPKPAEIIVLYAQLRQSALRKPSSEVAEVYGGRRIEHARRAVPSCASRFHERPIDVAHFLGQKGAAMLAKERREVLRRLRLLRLRRPRGGSYLWRSRRRAGVGGCRADRRAGRGSLLGSGGRLWKSDGRAAAAPVIREQKLGADVLAMEGDELAIAAQIPTRLGYERMVHDGRRHPLDRRQLSEGLREARPARVHRNCALATDLCPHRVPQGYAAGEHVVDGAWVALLGIIESLVQLGAHLELRILCHVLIALAHILCKVDAVAELCARVRS